MKKQAKTPAPTMNDPCESPLLSFMRNHKIPMTRKEFLDLDYMGCVPDEISPEEEMEFPRQFQLNPEPGEDSEE